VAEPDARRREGKRNGRQQGQINARRRRPRRYRTPVSAYSASAQAHPASRCWVYSV